MTEGSSRGSNTSDCVEEPESQTEAQPVVLGRGTATQHSQHTNRYFHFFSSWKFQRFMNLIFLFSVNICSCLFMSVLFCHVCIRFLFSDSPALYCICWLTPNSASLSLIIILSLSLSLFLLLDLFSGLFLCHCLLPSWSRFCRVGIPLSTRPCRTGAHAECFQFLPQIWNDLPMWILWHFVS